MEEEPSRSNVFHWKIAVIIGLWLLSVLITACNQQPPAPQPSPPTLESTPNVGPTTIPVDPAISSPNETVPFNDLGIALLANELITGEYEGAAVIPPTAPILGEPQPERINLSFFNNQTQGRFQIQVYPLTQYKELSPKAASSINKLETLLNEQPGSVDGEMPFLPWVDGLQISHSNPQYFNFQNGRGLSFIIKVDHDHNILTEEGLFYAFQGITNDGAYLVSALYPLQEGGEPLPALAASSSTMVDTVSASGPEINNLGVSAQNLESLPHIEATIRSMEISPAEFLDAAIVADYQFFPGIMLSIHPDLGQDIQFTKTPWSFESGDGTIHISPEIPDMIELAIKSPDNGEEIGSFLIEPVRDQEGNFFSDLPPAKIDQIIQNEEDIKLNTAVTNPESNQDATTQPLTFTNGHGYRWVNNDPGDQALIAQYQFDGITEDGRYHIHIKYPLDSADNPTAASAAVPGPMIDLLDAAIQSLVIDPYLSTQSSIPINQDDCTNDADFIADVTIPDNTSIERGTEFQKIWRVRNTGTCSWTPAYKLNLAGGNPLDWYDPIPIAVVHPEEEIEIGVSLLSPDVPGTYQAWWGLVDDLGQPFGSNFYVLFEAPRPATDIPGYGVIEGKISYPAGGMPSMTIYFLQTDSSERYALTTENGWVRYNNKIPAGEYYVFARVTGDESDSGGGYTEAVSCGLHASCDDHSLIPVKVVEGKATKDIDILDWFAPSGTFPLP